MATFTTPLRLTVTSVTATTVGQAPSVTFSVLDALGATLISNANFQLPFGASLADAQRALQGAINNMNQHLRNSGSAGAGGNPNAASLAQLVGQTFTANI